MSTTTAFAHEKLRKLAHRWFVEFNPLYLVSATLVLGGMVLLSRGLARQESLYGPLGVALVAEVYTVALIFGAALLTRIGQRRPAVLLALIAVLYHADLTLHTETCAFLGDVGSFASATWVALFAAKLRALAWALKLRLTRRAFAAATCGAAGLAIGPVLLAAHDARAFGTGFAVFVFALGTLVPRTTEGAATSLLPLDAWGRTVLRRAVRATWLLWGLLFALHALFWSSERPIDVVPLLPSLVLLAAHHASRKAPFWSTVLGTCLATFLIAPELTSLVSLLAAMALVRRAFGHVVTRATSHAAATPSPSPYRVGERERAADSPAAPLPSSFVFARVGERERVHLLQAALFALHAAVWTFGWRGGPLPDHLLALDGALSIAALASMHAWRARWAAAPLAAVWIHALGRAGFLPVPRSIVEWGAASVALGFLLLGGSLVASYKLRNVGAAPAPNTSSP